VSVLHEDVAVLDGVRCLGEARNLVVDPDDRAVQLAHSFFVAGSEGLSASGVNRALTSRSKSSALAYLAGL